MAEQAFPLSKDISLSECSFEDMKLRIGERLELELPDHPRPRPFFSRLIGYLPGQGLIVETPMENGLPTVLSEEEKILMRVFSGTQAFAFTCTVVRVCVSPYHYLHLSFPATVHGAQIRKTLRIKANLPASVFQAEYATCPLPVETTLVNLSIAGALLASPANLGNPGDQLKLRFSFFAEPDNKPVDMECEALIKSQKTDHGRLLYGISFQALHWSEAILLQNLVYKKVLDNYRNVA